MMAWKPLAPAVAVVKTRKEIREMARRLGKTFKQVKAVIDDEIANGQIWMNDVYQVSVRRAPAVGTRRGTVWLSIKRIDRKPVTDWRDKQRIKNQLVGEECEAVELYPAESRLVDTANQFHLWAVDDPAFRFPFGFDARETSDTEAGGSRQRPHEK